MNAMEVLLVVLGVGAYAASFIIPEKGGKKEAASFSEKEVKKLLEKQLPSLKDKMEEVSKEKAEEIAEQVERELEKLSNEKIMAVADYSKTVLDEIQKNHSEVMFLYSMLNDKEAELKESVTAMGQAKKEAQNFLAKTMDLVEKMDKQFDQVEEEFQHMDESLTAFGNSANQAIIDLQAKVNNVHGQVEAIQAQVEETRKQMDEITNQPSVIPSPVAAPASETKQEDSGAHTQEVPKEQEIAPVIMPAIDEMEKSLDKAEDNSLDDEKDIEFEQKLIDTLHNILPEFDLEENVPSKIQPEAIETSELKERDVKKSIFGFLKNQNNTSNKNEQVKELYRQGLSEVEIAKQLSIGRGEVRLIIGLMER